MPQHRIVASPTTPLSSSDIADGLRHIAFNLGDYDNMSEARFVTYCKQLETLLQSSYEIRLKVDQQLVSKLSSKLVGD
jgi:hypothetical protein